MNSLRKITSLSITFSFFIMTYTGIILFIAPKGRVANWINWEFLGLDKTQYTNLHVTFMVLFIVGIFVHLYLNYRPLLGYLKNKARSFSLLTKEFILAFGLNLLFVLGTLYYWVPFEQFLDFEDEIKSSWETKQDKAPYGHAELSSITEFAQKTGQKADDIIQKLSAKGLVNVTADQSIAAIAKSNNKSPADLFKMIETNPTGGKK